MKPAPTQDEREDAFRTLGVNMLSVMDGAGPDWETAKRAFDAAKAAALSSLKQLRFATHPDRFQDQADRATARFKALQDAVDLVRRSDLQPPPQAPAPRSSFSPFAPFVPFRPFEPFSPFAGFGSTPMPGQQRISIQNPDGSWTIFYGSVSVT